jgi:hypothetical protein
MSKFDKDCSIVSIFHLNYCFYHVILTIPVQSVHWDCSYNPVAFPNVPAGHSCTSAPVPVGQ